MHFLANFSAYFFSIFFSINIYFFSNMRFVFTLEFYSFSRFGWRREFFKELNEGQRCLVFLLGKTKHLDLILTFISQLLAVDYIILLTSIFWIPYGEFSIPREGLDETTFMSIVYSVFGLLNALHANKRNDFDVVVEYIGGNLYCYIEQ